MRHRRGEGYTAASGSSPELGSMTEKTRGGEGKERNRWRFVEIQEKLELFRKRRKERVDSTVSRLKAEKKAFA